MRTSAISIFTQEQNVVIEDLLSMMHVSEDTLSQLTGAQETSAGVSSNGLSSEWTESADGTSRSPTSLSSIERTAILRELSDILNLRGRLQQMGATFSQDGELQTYGNPSSPNAFEQMLKLGPMYEEQ
jgi:hypothetical protein